MRELLTQATTKEALFKAVESVLIEQGFPIARKDEQRPWGGFFAIDENKTEAFISKYFPHIDRASLDKTQRLSPKLLLVAPKKRLSWQYHHRRSEVWRAIDSRVGVVRSETDALGELSYIEEGEWITLAQGERHRLVGLDNWGLVAEIWQHTDSDNPSNEDDIVRVSDDFGR